jgi:hypothetical protein
MPHSLSRSPNAPRRAAGRRTSWRRKPGELATAEFLHGVLAATLGQLPAELRRLEFQQRWSLVQAHSGDPTVHFELWLHRDRERAELGLHFESRDPQRNRRMLASVEEELLFLKAMLGDGLEAELWDKGWTRVYLTRKLALLAPAEQAPLASQFARFIETVEPLRQAALELT